MNQNDSPPERRLTFKKKVLFLATIYLAFLVLLEIGARVVFYVSNDFSPFYLKYGFVPDVTDHSASGQGYTKFQPASIYEYKLSPARTIEMRINSDGFRGLEDFRRPKPAGVFRVVTLGASSTFGLVTEDDATYPYLLERFFDRTDAHPEVEVLNLAIPHLRLVNIVDLARAELPGLEPDLVTLYAGYNNSWVHTSPQQSGRLYRLKDWLKAHSVAYKGLNPKVQNVYYRLAKASRKDLLNLPSYGVPIPLGGTKIEAARANMRVEYRGQLEQLADIVEGLGARLMLVTQSYTLTRLPAHRLQIPTPSYAEEVAIVEAMLEEDGELLAPYATLLIHRDLMEETRALAAERGLPVVEGIEAIDEDRETMMASFVHLTPDGNCRVAEAIYAGIVTYALIPGIDVPGATASATDRPCPAERIE